MLRKTWHRITHIGVTEAMDSREARRVSYVNYCSLLVIAYALIRGCISLENIAYSIRLVSMAILSALVMCLNHYHFYMTAKVFLFTFSMSAVTFFTYFYLGGFNGGAYVALLTGVPLAFMLFDIKQRIHILSSLGFLITCLSILIILQYVHPHPTTVQINHDLVRISVTVLTLLVLLMLTWYFHSSNAHVEEELAKREKSLAEAQIIASLGNWSWDIVTNTISWSDETYRIFGVAPERFGATYEFFLECIHPDDREKINEAVDAALYEKEKYQVMHRIVLTDGTERMVQEQGKVTFDQDDNPIKMVGVVQDITERYKSEQRFKLAAEAITDLIYEWDVNTDTLSWFGDIDSALGFDKGEFPHTLQAWLERIHPDDLPNLQDAVDLHRNSIKPISYEYQIRRRDGSWVYWSDYGVPVLDGEGRPARWIGACTDITEKKKAEQKLTESEKRYQALFTNEIDAISIFEVETKKIVEVNDSWLKLYGYDRDEVARLTVEDVSAEPERTSKAVQQSSQTGTVFIPERRHKKRDGTPITVELAAGPFTWKGKLLMYALVRDITARKEAEDRIKKSEQLLAETQKIAQLGSWEFDVATETIKWSDETFRIAGRPAKDTLNLQEYLETVYPDDLPLLQKSIDTAMAEGQPYEVELRHQRPDGSINYTLTRGKPVFERDKIVKFIGSVLDITERKLTEQELYRAIKAAEAANKAKTTFLANMSHELRTPLNAIIGFSEMLTRDPSLSPEQLKNLQTIVRSGEYLLSLINDVLEFSKIEAGQINLHKENFNLPELLSGLEEMFVLRASQKGLSLNFEIEEELPCIIHTDQNKFRQILINLLGNAVKFTQSGGVKLQVTQSHEAPKDWKNNWVFLRCQVIDTGPGISHKEQVNIFDAFFQSDEQFSHQQGTGLGLPISRRFVDLLGGTLEVNSDIGKGTCFEFTLPVEKIDEVTKEFQMEKRVIALAGGQPNYRLLVAEDNENNRNLLVQLLKGVGFDVLTAVNGEDAVEKWRIWQPHLIWMDMRMPVMDGYTATRIIKGEIDSAISSIDTVIIAITATAFEEDRKKVIEFGGDDFVRKPFRDAEIFRIMEKHLKVKYVYEDYTGKTMKMSDSSRNIVFSSSEIDIPAATLQQLAESTELSDTEMIESIIEGIRNEHPELAETLFSLADNYAYDEILSLVYKMLRENEE